MIFQVKPTIIHTVKYGIILVFAVVFAFSVKTIWAVWSDPCLPPTGCNTDTPINVSATPQTKGGAVAPSSLFHLYNTADNILTFQRSGALNPTNFRLGTADSAFIINNDGFDTIKLDAGNVGIRIGASVPAYPLDVSGTVNMIGFRMPTGAVAGRVLTSDVSGVGTWTASATAPPLGASYVVMGLDGTLTAERVLTAGNGLTITDGGANGAATLNVGAGTGISVAADTVGLTNPTKACVSGAIQSFDLGSAALPTCASTGLTGGAANKVAYWTGPSALSQNTNFHWDNLNTRLGIGTATPGTKLEVAAGGSSGILVSGAGANGLRVTPSADANSAILNVTNAANSVNWLTVNANGQVIMNGTGNVGIGTTIPGGKLDISSTGAGTVALVVRGASGENWFPFTDGRNYIRGTTIIADTGGNVGIGTASPAYKLDVVGDVIATWFRSRGNAGWYNETYGGGWFMQDSTWIRAFGDKNVYTAGQIQGGTVYEGANRVCTGANGVCDTRYVRRGIWRGSCTILGAGSSCTITCPAGYQVVGGGVQLIGSPATALQTVNFYTNPISDTQWGCGSSNVGEVCYAICL